MPLRKYEPQKRVKPPLPPQPEILKYFEYDHLPIYLQKISESFHYIAHDMAESLPDNPERDVCLRKLLESKDCAVRAALNQKS